MKFLATPGNFPHPARNIAILQGDTKWECLYISPNNLDNQAKINKWNEANSTGKIKLARQDKWNHMHPDCPIDSNHPFSQSNGFICLLLPVVAFTFPKCYCLNSHLYWNSQNSSSRLPILLKHYNKHHLYHKLLPPVVYKLNRSNFYQLHTNTKRARSLPSATKNIGSLKNEGISSLKLCAQTSSLL